MKKITIRLLLLLICLGISACLNGAETHTGLEKLIVDVFNPQPGEQVLVMVDLPHEGLADFIDPKDAAHEDRVYPFGADIEVTKMTLEYEDGSSEVVIDNSAYTVFAKGE